MPINKCISQVPLLLLSTPSKGARYMYAHITKVVCRRKTIGSQENGTKAQETIQNLETELML